MDKQTFDIIEHFYLMSCEVYGNVCEKGMDMEEAEALVDGFDDYRDKLLRVGKYHVEEEYVNKDTYITEPYEDAERYLRFHVIYEYENGMTLCETTTGLLYLIPKKLLATYE